MAIILVGLLMLIAGFYFHYRETGPWSWVQRALIAAGGLVILIGVVLLKR